MTRKRKVVILIIVLRPTVKQMAQQERKLHANKLSTIIQL